jgi:hypothetical protein
VIGVRSTTVCKSQENKGVSRVTLNNSLFLQIIHLNCSDELFLYSTVFSEGYAIGESRIVISLIQVGAYEMGKYIFET